MGKFHNDGTFWVCGRNRCVENWADGPRGRHRCHGRKFYSHRTYRRDGSHWCTFHRHGTHRNERSSGCQFDRNGSDGNSGTKRF